MVSRYYNKATRRVGKLAKVWFSLGPEKFEDAVRTYLTALRSKSPQKLLRTKRSLREDLTKKRKDAA